MNRQTNIFLKRIDASLDYWISLVSIGLEIYLQQDLDTLQYFSIALLFLVGIAKFIQSKYKFGIKQDYTPLFFWSLSLVRMIFIKNINKDQTIIWLYSLGYSNGQYMSMIRFKWINEIVEIGKAIIQLGVLIGLLIYYFEEQLGSSIILIIMILFTQYHSYRQTIKLLELKIEDFNSQNKTNLNGSTNKLISRKYEAQELNIKEVESISRQEASKHQIKNQVEIQPPTQNIVWHQFIEQSEDYISKFYFSTNDLENSIDQAQSNYQMLKFLQDNKCQLLSLFKDLKVSNELNVKLNESNNQEKKQESLLEWITLNVNIQKFQDINYQRGLEENLVISSPIAQQSVVMMDAFIEKSISGISAIQLVQGSLEVSNLKSRKILYAKYNGKKQNYNFYIQISFFQEEVNNTQRQVIAVILRDLEKQVKQIKMNLKNIQKINSTIKFLQIQADLIQKTHRWVNQQQNQIPEIQRSSRQTTQFIKRTNSICSYKDSVDDGLSEVSEKGSKNSQISQFIYQLQFQFMKITQNNFNYFEVFSINDVVELEKKRVDITQTITLLLNYFQYDEIVIMKKISIQFNENLTNKIIITDVRRLKQLLFNIIYNSIKSYEYDNRNQKIQKIIQIVLKNYEENIRFQVIDNGCGLKDENINFKRIDDCKLGLAASQKLIKLLGGNDKQLQIFRSQSQNQTIVSFELPNTLFIDKAEIMRDDFDLETIQLVFTS
ncbi:unnamed protein product [Paramecium sonneborni]|uniref:Histidine kinase domain-containing protein n=1 Tax=Paramecium sonneborni TaxID=65129 RepID=A0A8S1NVT6_9CILI|nr:unnamed protein product [Paramecium sonneborni]